MMVQMLSITAKIPTTINPTPPTAPAGGVGVKKIPGSHGWPLVGPISDRLDYFWFQGQEKFFKNRMEKHKSSVYRTNVPPCFPFFVGVNPNVIAVLDCKSFAHLFDMEFVEKKDVLVGDFMPSVKFTGGMRVCAYLDPTEEHHTKIKGFAMEILKKSSGIWVSSLMSSLDTMWTTIEESLTKDSKATLLMPLQKCLFNFLSKSIIGADPANYSPEMSESGHIMLDKWLAIQLLPTVNVGLLQPLDEIFLHSFPYPFLLVKGDYEKLARFVAKEGKDMVRMGRTQFGLTEEESVHNLIFILGFNAFGGFSVFFPTLFSILAKNEGGVQETLRNEIREKCTSTAFLSFSAIKDMPYVQSFVYEALRLNPPVPLQYGRARKDFVLGSHDSSFEVKKGELLCGYQKLVMRDPKVFDDPETFVPDRFVGEKGQKMLNYLYWSNGPQSGNPSLSNKQCAAKDYVAHTACLFVAYFFLRYDSVTVDSSGAIIGLQKAT
ncbi:hypothetical protein RND81_08G019400 [Saponaria officinalis]|uniref:Uncharacterized protein n=1 Tax=Saponaria officinalis TaxID=3572 RepID=A0AAW1J261_SAPOF